MALDLNSDEPLNDNWAAEWIARHFKPDQYIGYRIVCTDEFCYFKHPDDVKPDDLVAFYDGDMRDVLPPDDPRVKALEGR